VERGNLTLLNNLWDVLGWGNWRRVFFWRSKHQVHERSGWAIWVATKSGVRIHFSSLPFDRWIEVYSQTSETPLLYRMWSSSERKSIFANPDGSILICLPKKIFFPLNFLVVSQQLVWLLELVAGRPRVFLADEPTGISIRSSQRNYGSVSRTSSGGPPLFQGNSCLRKRPTWHRLINMPRWKIESDEAI